MSISAALSKKFGEAYAVLGELAAISMSDADRVDLRLRFSQLVAGALGPPYFVDFVKDAGADPTGATDCGPAWTTAMGLLAALQSDNLRAVNGFTLMVPPGRYAFTNPATIGATFDFGGKASEIVILGQPGASIFEFDASPSGSFGAYANMRFMTIRGMTFRGLRNADTTAELLGLWNVNAQIGVLFDQCLFANLCTQDATIVTQSRTRFRDCNFFNCASKSATRGVIWGLNPSSLALERTVMDDTASFLNGFAFATNKVAVNVNQVKVDGVCEYLGIIDSFIDEGCDRNVACDGGASRVGLLEIRGSIINPAIHGSAVAAIQAIKCNHVLVDSMREVTLSNAVPFFDLQSVRRADLYAITPAGSLVAPWIKTDAACGVIRTYDSPSLLPDLIQTNASMTVDESAGLVSDYLATGSAIVQNQLVKMTAAGTVSSCGLADTVSLVRGPSLDTAVGAAHTVRVGRPHQPVTVLSDGAGVIAVGDRLTLSAASAGRVKKNAGAGSAAVGYALTGAAAVADTAFSMMFLPQVV